MLGTVTAPRASSFASGPSTVLSLLVRLQVRGIPWPAAGLVWFQRNAQHIVSIALILGLATHIRQRTLSFVLARTIKASKRQRLEPRWSSKRDEFNIHHQCGAWRNDGRVASRTIGHCWRDCDLGPLPATHTLHGDVEARDDLSESNTKFERGFSVPR